MLTGRAVAEVVFRCLGIFTILSSLFHLATYFPAVQASPRGGLFPWGVFLPLVSGIASGVCLLLFARFLASLVTRDTE